MKPNTHQCAVDFEAMTGLDKSGNAMNDGLHYIKGGGVDRRVNSLIDLINATMLFMVMEGDDVMWVDTTGWIPRHARLLESEINIMTKLVGIFPYVNNNLKGDKTLILIIQGKYSRSSGTSIFLVVQVGKEKGAFEIFKWAELATYSRRGCDHFGKYTKWYRYHCFYPGGHDEGAIKNLGKGSDGNLMLEH
ncbi:hypothetical protein BCR42DRAFT_385847 [Absidia repens]|uniref:Uncharacterized protein n=1 Tax=Absidia repens TaxID=90262 RepID=A0A1X2J039_9FUNG|nr:hypothetical protein BCR42DRAFT_385847 [Absidia repens]